MPRAGKSMSYGISTFGPTTGATRMPITTNAVASEVQRINRGTLRGSYDYVIVGAGASDSVIAGELAKSGADILLVESGRYRIDASKYFQSSRPPGGRGLGAASVSDFP
jgi:hypothetical protein